LYTDIIALEEYVAGQLQSTQTLQSIETNTTTYICTLYSILNCTFYAYYTYMHETKNACHTYCVKLSGPFYVHHENKFSSLAQFVLVLLSRYRNWAMGWMTKEQGFDSGQSQEIFLFSIVSRTALGPTKLPI
jgi:hypothetical protein